MIVKIFVVAVTLTLAGVWCFCAETADVWVCAKCNTRIEAVRQPRQTKCPAAGYHQWNRVAHVGETYFMCRKCALKIRSSSWPRATPCLGGGYHVWDKL